MADDLSGIGIITLARLTHEAEEAEDDLRFLAIQAEIERRPTAEQEAYRLEWVRQISERARLRRAGA